MQRWRTIFLCILPAAFILGLALGCSDDGGENEDGDTSNPDGDFILDGDTSDPDGDETPDGDVSLDEILDTPVDEALLLDGLDDNVAVAWDTWGIPHIYAKNQHDAMMALGYIQAGERFMEMEFIRKVSTGRLTDLLGTTLPGIIENDIFMRQIFSLKDGGNLLQAMWDALSQNSKDAITDFTAGVNARLAAYRADDGDWPEPFGHPFVKQSPEQTDDWDVLDTVAIARYQTWSLSGTYGEELNETLLYAALPEEFFTETIFTEPSTHTAILPGASENSHPGSGRKSSAPARRVKYMETLKRMLDRFNAVLDFDILSGRTGDVGSNNWSVAPDENGVAYLCNDPHLSLQNPPVWIPVTLDTLAMEGEDGLHAGGVAFPGTPAVAIGRNADVAWGETVANFDVLDIYEETVTRDNDDNIVSVLFDGQQVPVEKVTMQFRKGHDGEPVYEQRDVLFVPHHGPILEDDGETVLSMRWTGMEVTAEIDTFMHLHYAENLDDAFAATEYFAVGAQNFNYATVDGEIGWYPHAWVPIRKGDLEAHPPWRVLPGTGEYEWDGYVDKALLPQSKNPTEGMIVTANNDTNGSLFDNDPLNEDGAPDTYLHFGVADGWRGYSCFEGVKSIVAAGDYGWEDFADLQFNQTSGFATEVAPMIVGLAERYGLGAELSADAATGLDLIKAENWSYRLASGLQDHTDPASSAINEDEKADSAAATFFQFLIVRLAHELFYDEVSAAGLSGMGGHERKALLKILRKLYNDGVTDGDVSPAWDDVNTSDAVETPADILKAALEATVQDILGREEYTGLTLGEAMWGRVHTITFTHLMASLPSGSNYNYGPFGMGGSSYTVNPGSFGLDLADPAAETYTYRSGASMRMTHQVDANGITTHFVLPGGVSERQDAAHYFDISHLWATGETLVLDIEWEKVKAAGIEKMTALVAAP